MEGAHRCHPLCQTPVVPWAETLGHSRSCTGGRTVQGAEGTEPDQVVITEVVGGCSVRALQK